MRRYFVYRGRRLVGGIEATSRTVKMLRDNGYRVVPA